MNIMLFYYYHVILKLSLFGCNSFHFFNRVYKNSPSEHIIANSACEEKIVLHKKNLPDTGLSASSL